MSVPKAKALEVIRALLSRAKTLSPVDGWDQEVRLWQKEAMATARTVFGESSPQVVSFNEIGYTHYKHSVYSLSSESTVDEPTADEDREAVIEGLANARTHFVAWISEIENFWPDDVAAPSPPSPLEHVVALCNRFSDVAARLNRRRATRPALVMTDEYDVQYLLGALLASQFDDVRDEDPVPSHAGATSRVDFFLKTERVIVETKMTRDNLRAKEVGEELLVDIGRYEARSDCDCLVCLVYDPAHHITNPRGLERDLQATSNRLTIRVLVRS